MTTKKDLLIEKYIILLDSIKIHTDVKIFPDLNNFELYEILYYFQLYFFNICKYRWKLRILFNFNISSY